MSINSPSIIKSLATGLLFAALTATAYAKKQPIDAIKVNRSVSYFKDSVGSTEIRRCDWNKRIVAEIVDEADGRVQITDENLAKVPGRTLSLVVISVQANGSEREGFPNWIHVRGELKQGQQVIAVFTAKTEPRIVKQVRKVNACQVLDKISGELIEEIADWTKKPADARLGYKGYD